MDSLEHIKEKFYTIAADMEFELVELAWLNLGGRSVIRAYIHKAGGVSIGNCAALSRAYSDYLDMEDVIHGKYTLEVSSLGLDRPLVKPGDFKRRLNEKISLELQPGVYPKNMAVGELAEVDDTGVTISNDGQILHFMFEQIVRGKLIL